MIKKQVQAYLDNFWLLKGQLISKWFLGYQFPPKNVKNGFNFTTMRHVFVRFLEEIDDPEKTF